VGRPGISRVEDIPPAGIAPILRASWRFARETAQRFSKELLSDRTKDFLNALVRKFT
jgi:hypothetical protein